MPVAQSPASSGNRKLCTTGSDISSRSCAAAGPACCGGQDDRATGEAAAGFVVAFPGQDEQHWEPKHLTQESSRWFQANDGNRVSAPLGRMRRATGRRRCSGPAKLTDAVEATPCAAIRMIPLQKNHINVMSCNQCEPHHQQTVYSAQ